MAAQEKIKGREKWATKIGFILTAAGFSVGLGNIWRFPYVTGKYGGGAFVLLYLVFMVIVAIPLFIVEFTLGRSSKSSITTGYKKLAPKKPWFIGGWFAIIATILLVSYYTMIMGWIFAYLWKSIKAQYLGMTADQIKEMFTNFTSRSHEVFLWQILVYIILGIIVSRGLVKGIEAFNKYAMPILFLIIIGLGVYSLTLPGAFKGVEFYLKPDFSEIQLEAVFAALGQVFYSVGIGFGVTWTYGSYLDRKANIPGNAVRIALLDTVGALLAGFIIFPAAFAFGVNPGSGYDLIFVTLPNIFGKMSGGAVFGILFFFLISIAAFTSAIADTEGIASCLMDECKWDRSKSRPKAVWITLFSCFLIGIPSVLSFGPWSEIKLFGLSIFGFIDYITPNILLILAALAMSLFVGWHLGIKKFMEMANLGAVRIKVTPYWNLLIKFIIPLFILLLFFGQILGS